MSDLEDLAWVSLQAPTLGPVTIPSGSGDFLKWTRDGLKSYRWADGLGLARDLLATQARPRRDADPIGAEAVTALSDADIDQFAEAFLAATGAYFRPRTISEGVSAQRKVRQRKDGEEVDLGPVSGETAADRLKRLLEGWIQDRSDFNTMMASRAGIPSVDLVKQAREAMGVTRLVDDHRKLMQMANPLADLAAVTRAINPISTLADAIRPPAMLDAIRAASQLPTSGIVAQIREQQAQMRALARLATPVRSDLLDSLKLYRNLASDLRSSIALATEPSRSIRALLDSVKASEAARRSAMGLLADQTAFAAAIGKQFDLRLPAATLAAMTALTTTSALADAVRTQSFFPPGFQMAAALGLQHSVGAGLVADVLHHYDEAATDAPAFAEALQSAVIVDAGELTDEEAISFLQRVADWLQTAIRNDLDTIRRAGLLSVLSFVITMMSLYVGMEGVHYGREGAEIAKESLAVAKAGSTHDDLTALIKETQVTREVIKAGQNSDRAHDRIRYVHERTPLRLEPQAHAPILRLVYPDQLIRIVDEQGDWLKVEVFDYHSDQPMRGWMSRRRLKLQPAP